MILRDSDTGGPRLVALIWNHIKSEPQNIE
jgi:hypothetical protein